jgi:hypothetical protein
MTYLSPLHACVGVFSTRREAAISSGIVQIHTTAGLQISFLNSTKLILRVLFLFKSIAAI